MAIQMRDFEIEPGRMAEFVDAWRQGVVPLRQRQGFRIPGAWTVPGEDRFIWLLEADGSRAEFEARDARYYESEDRAGVDPDPRQWIQAHSAHFLDPVTPGSTG
jgi:hypothetical protein